MNMNKGKLRAVDNIEKQRSSKNRERECKVYYSIYLEDIKGENESTVLLTEDEVNKLKQVSLPICITDKMVNGRLYPFSIGTGKPSYIVKVVHEELGEYVVQFSKRLYNKGIKRAAKHPDSTPKKGLLEDLLD